MEQHKAALENAGLQVLAISMGEPKHAQRYCGKFAPHIDCLVNDTSKAHRTYGLLQAGLKEFATPNVVKTYVELAANGIFNGETTGNWLMMPGFFIVDEGGIVRYVYYAKDIADHPKMDDVIHAAQGLSNKS